MDKTPYSPIVLLRCDKCRNKTPHVLISFSNKPLLAISMVYECQECGKTKKGFDLNTLPLNWEPTTEIKAEEKEPTISIPIARGPQIEQPAS
jgi:DNA-directed RNA polymerase subunit RPC12/RpoP